MVNELLDIVPYSQIFDQFDKTWGRGYCSSFIDVTTKVIETVNVLKDSEKLCVVSRFWIMAPFFASVHVSWHSHRLLTTGLQLFLLTTFADSFLRSRSSQDHEATAMIKAQFMSMWDGIITDPNCRIMIVAATNRPSDIDPAILRRLPCQFNIKKPVRNLCFF